MSDCRWLLEFAKSCVTVLGLDVDLGKVEQLNKGQSYIRHIDSAAIAELVSAGKFSASTDFSRTKEVEAVIICVPTSLERVMNFFADKSVLFTYNQALRLGWHIKHEGPRAITRAM
jgi:UDP-N-acetyl-D-mannosaminuronate dehydrogenase